MNWILLIVLVSREIHGNAKKMGWVLLSPDITFYEIATLVDAIELIKPAGRAKAGSWIAPIKVSRLADKRPCPAVQRLARQSPLRHENSCLCRLHIDLDCVGQPALSTGRNELEEPRSRNEYVPPSRFTAENNSWRQ